MYVGLHLGCIGTQRRDAAHAGTGHAVEVGVARLVPDVREYEGCFPGDVALAGGMRLDMGIADKVLLRRAVDCRPDDVILPVDLEGPLQPAAVRDHRKHGATLGGLVIGCTLPQCLKDGPHWLLTSAFALTCGLLE